MPYIALDFEATCDEPDNPDPQEIIENPQELFIRDSNGLAVGENQTQRCALGGGLPGDLFD